MALSGGLMTSMASAQINRDNNNPGAAEHLWKMKRILIKISSNHQMYTGRIVQQ